MMGQMQALRRQQEMEARMAYEKKMHHDQAMRSMQLGQQAQSHTPNTSTLDMASPLAQGAVPGASPLNAVASRQMQRELSKGGAMLPPRSPALTVQRTSTPQLLTSAKTPQTTKEDSIVCLIFYFHQCSLMNVCPA